MEQPRDRLTGAPESLGGLRDSPIGTGDPSSELQPRMPNAGQAVPKPAPASREPVGSFGTANVANNSGIEVDTSGTSTSANAGFGLRIVRAHSQSTTVSFRPS